MDGRKPDMFIKKYKDNLILNIDKKDKYIIIYGDCTIFLKDIFLNFGGKFKNKDSKIFWLFDQENQNIINFLELLIDETNTEIPYKSIEKYLEEKNNHINITFNNFNNNNYGTVLIRCLKEF